MYEYISGPVAEVAPAYAVIDAGGVGYYLPISLETFSAIEHTETARLYVHYVVREDAQLLYGFATKTERELFRHLISVSGVGGNTARMILSTYSPRELQGIITSGNAVLLKNVKGLGLKTAQKIIVELTGKLTALGAGGGAPRGDRRGPLGAGHARLCQNCRREGSSRHSARKSGGFGRGFGANGLKKPMKSLFSSTKSNNSPPRLFGLVRYLLYLCTRYLILLIYGRTNPSWLYRYPARGVRLCLPDRCRRHISEATANSTSQKSPERLLSVA